FEMLSNQELDYVADLSRPRRFGAGQMIIEEGELGDSVYVIASGEVEVVRKDASGAEKVITVLGPREFFGERSLIVKEYRSATVPRAGSRGAAPPPLREPPPPPQASPRGLRLRGEQHRAHLVGPAARGQHPARRPPVNRRLATGDDRLGGAVFPVVTVTCVD